jgi:hypothetical protein
LSSHTSSFAGQKGLKFLDLVPVDTDYDTDAGVSVQVDDALVTWTSKLVHAIPEEPLKIDPGDQTAAPLNGKTIVASDGQVLYAPAVAVAYAHRNNATCWIEKQAAGEALACTNDYHESFIQFPEVLYRQTGLRNVVFDGRFGDDPARASDADMIDPAITGRWLGAGESKPLFQLGPSRLGLFSDNTGRTLTLKTWIDASASPKRLVMRVTDDTGVDKVEGGYDACIYKTEVKKLTLRCAKAADKGYPKDFDKSSEVYTRQ